MKQTFKNTTFAITLFAALAACDDNSSVDFSKAKTIKAVYAVKNIPTVMPTSAELDLISSAGTNNMRRVKSLLADKKAPVTAVDENGITAFMTAAKSNNVDIIEELAGYLNDKNRSIIDAGDKDGQTALHYATQAGNVDAIEALLDAGANPNIYDASQQFPLHIAAVKNDLNSMNALLYIDSGRVPTNVDLENGTGESALLRAVANRSLEMITTLVDRQADINTSDANGITPLIYAVKNGDKDLFDFLLKSGADINHVSPNEETALIYAIKNARYDFAKFILDRGANPNTFAKGLYSPLQVLVAQEKADVSLVEMLIAKGATLKSENSADGNVLTRAMKKGNANVIAILIKNGASVQDLETSTSNGIIEGFKSEDEEIVKLMIENGADVKKLDESGFSTLALAAKSGMTEVFDMLVKKGADVNQTSKNAAAVPLDIVLDKENATMLEIMFKSGLKANPDALLVRIVGEGKFKLLPLLLANGAKTDAINSIGQPMLWLAASKENIEAVKLMAEAGANLEVKDKEKQLTPLAIAIIKKNLEISDYLLNQGADPNNGDINGITPLAYAALTGQDELVKSIIAKGGDVNAKDTGGRTILSLMDVSRLDKASTARMKELLIAAGGK